MSIECLDPVGPKPRLATGQIIERIEEMARFPARKTHGHYRMQNGVKKSVGFNVFEPIHMKGALAKQVYWPAFFQLDDGEALIIETDLPKRRPYWNIQLNAPFNALEYVYRLSSINGHTARISSDGRFRAVIARDDPGVPNWLDPAGYREGGITGAGTTATAARSRSSSACHSPSCAGTCQKAPRSLRPKSGPRSCAGGCGRASGSRMGPLAKLTSRASDSSFDLNVRSAFLCTHEAGQHMIAQRSGAIVNVSSNAGNHSVKGGAHYASANAALQMFTSVTAAEWGRYSIRANCVGAGMIASERAVAAGKAARLDTDNLTAIPLRRTGTPNEVANMIVLFASDAASYISGQTVAVNGGPSMSGIPDN